MASLFDQQASVYAVARPTYPSALFDLLSSLTKKHERAWDVGTGNGQAAIGLAHHYDQIIATDISEQQLKYAAKRPNIRYALMSPSFSTEEVTEIVGGEASVDLVTVAEAVHWFDLDSFYEQVNRVLRKPGGVIAVWCYGMPKVNSQVDKLLEDFYQKTRAYRGQEGDLVMGGYESLHFPFDEVMNTGSISMNATKEITMDGLLGLLLSSSAVNTARSRGVELVNEHLEHALRVAWGFPVDQVQTITFPLQLRIGCPRLTTSCTN